MRASARSLLVLAVIAATCTQAGDVWRWKDAQGVVHYSDVPIQGAVLGRSRSDDELAASLQAAAVPISTPKHLAQIGTCRPSKKKLRSGS